MEKHINCGDITYFVVVDRYFGQHKVNANPSDNRIHGGTLDGIIEKLDYLIELGITAIWVTPVYENIQNNGSSEPYHYYWPKDFNKIDSRLIDGTHLPNSTDMKNFGKFVDLCESRNIKVILDMVVNHSGYGTKANFNSNWFNMNGQDDITMELAGLPDFDHKKPEVIDFFIQNIQDWIEKGKVSNIRMDTVKHVAPKFWHYFKSQIGNQYPDLFLIGEVLCEGKQDVEKLLSYQNYHDFDSIFDFPLCTALRSALIYDEDISYWLARPRLSDNEEPGVLDNDNPMKGGYRNSNMLGILCDNHDLDKRIMSHARTKHQGDTIGLDWAIRVTKLCLGALFTMRGIPQLYYGTEIGMEGWKDQDDRDLRRDFPWDIIDHQHHPKPQFKKEKEIYWWTKDLIKIRKLNPAFSQGTTITLWADHLVYAYLRIASDDVALVIINNGYLQMPMPIRLILNPAIITQWVIDMIKNELIHWKTHQPLVVQNNEVMIQVEGKTIEIFCHKGC